MAVKIQIPSPLRSLTNGNESIEADIGTLQSVFDQLMAKYPQLYARLFDDTGALQHSINVYINDEDIRQFRQLQSNSTGSTRETETLRPIGDEDVLLTRFSPTNVIPHIKLARGDEISIVPAIAGG
jgi:sulfur-carrier protein